MTRRLMGITAGLLLALVAAACGSNDPATTATPATSVTSRASALVVPERLDEVGATSAWRNSIRATTEARWGDYWDAWDAKSQASMSREEYLRLVRSCPASEPNNLADQMTLTVVDTDAYLELAGIETGDPIMTYEDEHWRRIPLLDEIRADPCMDG